MVTSNSTLSRYLGYKNALRQLLLLCLVGSCACLAIGQSKFPKHALKLNLSTPLRAGLGLAYEFRPTAGSGLEIQLHYKRYNKTPATIFNGDRVVEYVERRIDTVVVWSGEVLDKDSWYYLGENRPLPNFPEWFALDAGYIQLGYSFTLNTTNTRWRFFLQPGLFAGYYQFYTTTDNTRILDKTIETWTIQYFPVVQAQRQTVFYEQTRSMRLEKHFFYGLSYQAGTGWFLGKHFFLEARGIVNLNLKPPPEPYPAAPVRRLSAQLALGLGYQF
jgi:hypothetical protein